MDQRTHLFAITILLLSSFRPIAAYLNTSFDLSVFSLRNLTLLGDSYLKNGSSIGLTRETTVPSSGSGTAACNSPIVFHDPTTNASASFSTNFSFSIANANGPSSSGDGMAFFISPSDKTLGSSGGFLGLFNASTAGNGKIFAVEFDTRVDGEFGDPGPNHVGLDVGGPASVDATDVGRFGIDLKSGRLIYAWIDYDNHEKMLKIWLDYTHVKPQNPVLTVNYDLSERFEELMYVGFSASTEGSTEVHTVEGWSFRTFGFPPNPNVSSLTPGNSSNSSSSTVIPSLSVTKPEDRHRLQKKLGLVLSIAAPITFFLFFMLSVWVLIRKRLGERGERLDAVVLKGPRKFSHKEISIATRDFHFGRVIGNGSFGTVYRAVQPGSVVTYAVKRSKHSHRDKSDFLAELSIIASLRHKNLVQLKGWCDEKGELLLVYEFMPNGSLDKVLYRGGNLEPGACPSTTFKWPQRYNVAVGIASVLTYLHEECERQVIHRDIKTSNIMLDAGFNPRLGDFGLARLMEHNESPLSTLTAGTLGYLAPEYVQYGKATEKTDVFSFGVVVLEVCCGRRPIDRTDRCNNNDDSVVNLVDWVWALHAKDKLVEAADPRLKGEFDREEMLRLLLVGLSCANPDCRERPSMRRVIQMLTFEMEPLRVPRSKPCLTFSGSLPKSLNDIISDVEE